MFHFLKTLFGGPAPQNIDKVRPAFIRFLHEQDGPRERKLKDALNVFFETERVVQKAFLARLDIGDSVQPTVGLCLRANPLPEESFVARVEKLFISVLGEGGFLHVLFLRDDQEAELIRVCKPFYESHHQAAQQDKSSARGNPRH
jgi:hypothetical protein